MKKKLKIIPIVFIATMQIACSHEKEDKPTPSLGKYVYIDDENILHAKSKCMLGMKTTDENGLRSYKSIEFLDTAEVTTTHLKSCCSWCVTDERYEQLKLIADKHRKADEKAKQSAKSQFSIYD